MKKNWTEESEIVFLFLVWVFSEVFYCFRLILPLSCHDEVHAKAVQKSRQTFYGVDI